MPPAGPHTPLVYEGRQTPKHDAHVCDQTPRLEGAIDDGYTEGQHGKGCKTYMPKRSQRSRRLNCRSSAATSSGLSGALMPSRRSSSR